MGRRPCCEKEGLNRGAWTLMEDKILKEYIQIHGEGKWRNLPKKAGLQRCGKSCRLRWLNYLRPGIKRGNITHDEEDLIIRLHKLLGNRWSLIAGRLPGRTDNEIKNYWNTIIGKKLQNRESHNINLHSHDSENSLEKNVKDHSHENNRPNVSLKDSKSHQNANDNNNIADHGDSKFFYTKASRCSQVVVIPPAGGEPQNNNNYNGTPSSEVTTSVFCSSIEEKWLLAESSSLLDFTLKKEEDNNSSSDDILLDFEMDEQLLSDLLNADYSELINSFDINGGAAARDANIYTCDQGQGPSGQSQLSPDYYDESLLGYSSTDDHVTQDFGFPSVDSLMDSEFHWF